MGNENSKKCECRGCQIKEMNDEIRERAAGKGCYNAYKESCGGKTWDGKDMMEFLDMPEDKQIHWIKAGMWNINCTTE